MALHGSQKKFDKNGDGRLNTREWQNWYLRTYGLDIEREERQKASQREAGWDEWLGQKAYRTHMAAERFLAAAVSLLDSDRLETRILAWKAMLCQVTTVLIDGTLWDRCEQTAPGMFVPGTTFYPYRALAYDLANISAVCSKKELEKAAQRRQPLYQEEGALTEKDCGAFWSRVIGQLSPYYKDYQGECYENQLSLRLLPGTEDTIEKSLDALQENLVELLNVFADEAASSDLEDRFSENFAAHWIDQRSTWIIFLNTTAEQLYGDFPHLRERHTPKELVEIYGVDLLRELYDMDAPKALLLWRSTAGTEAPLFDPKAAYTFLWAMELVWYDGDTDPELLRPLVEMLRKDDGFAQQIFWSAYVDYFQLAVIKAAKFCGYPDLAEHLFDLLKGNPLPEDEWQEPYEDIEEMMEEPSAPEEAPEPVRPHNAGPTEIPDDGTVYHYCQVSFPDIKRTYSYLVGQQELHVGDRVYVPFGREDEEKLGTVVIVGQYLRSTAPYPPERTKKILKKV